MQCVSRLAFLRQTHLVHAVQLWLLCQDANSTSWWVEEGYGLQAKGCTSSRVGVKPAAPQLCTPTQQTLVVHCSTERQKLDRHIHVTVSQGFEGPQSSYSCICTCTCITNYFFSSTDTAASASAIFFQQCTLVYWLDALSFYLPMQITKMCAAL